ncbi:MAG: hypothetical protein EPO22_11295 [Dehalococcoidia bacterium]|nr:MAG: hypothetical protein EPO22_11295 [Dehalococcoidia bacterium]
MFDANVVAPSEPSPNIGPTGNGAATVIPVWLPVMLDVTVSVAISDCVPTVLSVAENVRMPLSPAVNV